MSRRQGNPAKRIPLLLVVRVCIATALVISAVIHIQLAPDYQQAAPAGIGQGTLFLIQGSAAVLAAAFVLLKGSRTAFAAAAMVGVSSLAAVILYRYVRVPALGPLPSMYEPVWYAAKVVTAVAEATAGGLALTGYALLHKARRQSHTEKDDRLHAASSTWSRRGRHL
ncbi:hypothetical protein [Arthrobacter sp. ISL-69]|uniref:hypothetical protein n=1 Tax=Arthrobacter sp. ISL-69 TaxID=2819113 RepID=UPI001BEB987B|nr:hypothetical protein [Arthrobacter sp. ISL-69]MBT2538467.1 hypothetical protein [Arthrobacter sp. ISL-69]